MTFGTTSSTVDKHRLHVRKVATLSQISLSSHPHFVHLTMQSLLEPLYTDHVLCQFEYLALCLNGEFTVEWNEIQRLLWKVLNHEEVHTVLWPAINSTHPVSFSSCSCSAMKHSSHTDRYSMAILASFLYAFPMAPLFGSNWTTFTTLCEEIKENDWRTMKIRTTPIEQNIPPIMCAVLSNAAV